MSDICTPLITSQIYIGILFTKQSLIVVDGLTKSHSFANGIYSCYSKEYSKDKKELSSMVGNMHWMLLAAEIKWGKEYEDKRDKAILLTV